MSSRQILAGGNTTKAGLPSSFDEINARIAEVSKDSRFAAAQTRKSAELEVKIAGQRDQLRRALDQPVLVSKARKSVDNLMKELEKEQAEQFSRSEEFCWVCVDMDAFYASVECLDSPELSSIPMAVGSASMLSTANYEARKFGVSAGMPGYIAKTLCPDLRIVPLRFDRYREMSGKVAEILQNYDENLTMWSLDEAFLRLKRKDNLVGFEEMVRGMREEVKQKTGLTCSAGIACNPLLAKLASNYRKPDGQFEIDRSDLQRMRNFLFDQPVRKLSGIGRVMALKLEKVLDIRRVGELYAKRHLLPLIFRDKTVRSLVSKCIGHSTDQSHEPGNEETCPQKSLSCERTFQAGSVNLHDLLREICENLVEEVRGMGISGIGRIGIKVKSSDFRVFTREKACHLKVASLDGKLLVDLSRELMDEFLNGEEEEMELRLLGVKLSAFKQETLFRKRTLLEDWLQEKEQAKCPICCKALRDGNDLGQVNGHIDLCLSKSTINDLV